MAMIKIRTDLDRNHSAAAHPAYFDLTVVSATGFDETSDRSGHPVNLLVKGLNVLEKSTVLLDCAHFGDTGFPLSARSQTSARRAILHEVIAPRFASQAGGDAGLHSNPYPDKVFYAAAKLLCLDDQLFNLKGGGEFVRMTVSTARRAGRATALLCTDLPTAFHKRREIVDCFDGVLDFVVGEPREVLSLFGLSRIDSLVPKLIQLGTGLALYRAGNPSISIRPKSKAAEIDDNKISREAFWSEFVPLAFDEFLVPGSTTI